MAESTQVDNRGDRLMELRNLELCFTPVMPLL